MKFRQLLSVIPFVAVLVVLFGLIAVDPVSPGTDPTRFPASDKANVPAANVELPATINADLSATTESADSQTVLTYDGSKLLQIYCSECHSVGLLERTERPREAWEKILLRMEKSGVHLNDSERSALLDHLTGRDEP